MFVEGQVSGFGGLERIKHGFRGVGLGWLRIQ